MYSFTKIWFLLMEHKITNKTLFVIDTVPTPITTYQPLANQHNLSRLPGLCLKTYKLHEPLIVFHTVSVSFPTKPSQLKL